MRRLGRYLVRRLAQAALVVLCVIILTFVLLHLMPGDIVDVLAGEASATDIGYLQDLRQKFGLDRPFLEQLGIFVWRMVQFDLGHSFRHNMPVFDLIADRLPATLLLLLTAIVLAIALGVVLGVTAARRIGTPIDAAISVLSILFYATPVFWIGLMLIVLFTVTLQWLPSSGMTTIGANNGSMDYLVDVARHLVMPAVTLALFYVALYTRIMRASMLEVLRLDYIRAARALGLPSRRVAFQHALPNAILPMITLVGVQVGHLLGGAILVETVFGWPGIGRLAFEAVFQRDLNLLLGILFFSALLVVAINLLIDLLYAWIDPRIELG
ncbi:MAG: ABC transporter permease [Alphaproteobacteria bacterium]